MLSPSAFNNDFFFITIIGSVSTKNVYIITFVKKKNNADGNKNNLGAACGKYFEIRRKDFEKTNISTLSKRNIEVINIIPNAKNDKYLFVAFLISAFALSGSSAFIFFNILIEIAVKKAPMNI